MNHITKTAVAALIALVGCDAPEGTTVGPRGGIVTSDDGRFSLEIPEGALDQSIDITVEAVACERPDALGTCYEVSPVGLPFLFPATLTYELDPNVLTNFSADELVVIVEKEETWDRLADRTVDNDNQTVSASALYLSAFTVVADER